ncbi:hypothetical protein GQ457_14G017780 [Hibiscus cannabinus]
MATAPPKVRLVTCPKCLLVLPEVTDFLVYKCGGCDTILVAKSKKAIAKSTYVLQETDASKSEHGKSISSGLQEVLPSPSESWSSQESGGNQDISIGSRSEENLSVEGQHNGRYKKDQNTSSYSNGDGESDRDMLDKSRSNEGQQNATELLQTESLGPYKKDHNTSGDSDGDGNCGVLVENRFNEGSQNETGLDCDGDGDDESDHGILDENGSNEGKQNGTGLQPMEAFDDCNDQQIRVSIEGSVSTELHHENEKSMLAAETNLEAEGNDNTLQLEGVNSELGTSIKIDSNPRGSRVVEHCGISRTRSTDTFEIVDFVSLCSKFSGPPECLSKSTTIRSSHAYDGIQKKHNEMEKNGKWHRDEPLEPGSLLGYESACPSHESRVEFPFDSALHPFEKAKYSEEENMKLLRMVHELQDQISRTCNLNGKTNVSASTDIPWKQKHYNNHHEPPDDENFYPAYNGKRGWNQRSRISHVPFSEGAINTRHGIDLEVQGLLY